MHPTDGQSSGGSSARSSRFPKSVGCTIATSGGRPDLASPAPSCPISSPRSAPSFGQAARRPHPELCLFPRGSDGPKLPTAPPPTRCLQSPGVPGLSRERGSSSTESDAVWAKDRASRPPPSLPQNRHAPRRARRCKRRVFNGLQITLGIGTRIGGVAPGFEYLHSEPKIFLDMNSQNCHKCQYRHEAPPSIYSTLFGENG